MTWKPSRLRASSVGSAAHIRKAATSRPYWSTVVGVPSVYSTWPSLSGFGMPMAPAGKIFVVLRARRQREAGRRVGIAVEDGVDVVGAVLLVIDEGVDDELRETPFVAARLGQHRHVGRQLAAERGARGLVVGERRREMIG